jgi:hypothetical protein
MSLAKTRLLCAAESAAATAPGAKALVELAEQYEGEAFSSAASCPICAGPSKVAHTAVNIHPEKPYSFDFRVCNRCGHGWIDPMPSQGLLTHLYRRGSHSVVGVGWAETEDESLTVPERLVAERELSVRGGGGRYFELGVGKGRLYHRFLQAGWQCTGVEPGAWGRGLTGIYADLDSLPGQFVADVIVALDVLEHVADPKSTLRRLRALAARHTRLYCAMPNRQSLRARLDRERWRMLRPLGHVNYWSKKSLVRALNQSGLAAAELHRTDLWKPRPIRKWRDVAAAAVEHLGLGDQWVAVARVDPSPGPY